ncbi:MAG: type II toxin-antitoxin system VapC family toxin [Mycobacteriales bacterium]
MILLDTHVVVWLYADAQNRIPLAVAQRLNTEQLGLSPFVQLELAYLSEIGRITVSAQAILDDLGSKLELTLTDSPSALLCQTATHLTWTRDPFDRLLAAQAIATDTPLVTKDRVLRQHCDLAWWQD